MLLSKSTPIRIELALLVGVLLVSGCSSSNGPSSEDTQSVASVAAPNDFDDSSGAPSSGADTSTSNDDDAPRSPQGESDTSTPHTTQVNFDITVPSYVSNELRVGLLWGEKDFTAQWVGDEFWNASADFETDTEHLLSVTFYDGNGDIVLGSYEANYKTGFNDAASYQITADQFDTSRSDDDGDGLSNLAELIAGTDPLFDESDQSEIIITDTVGIHFPLFEVAVNAAGHYEAEILTLTLPIYIQEEVIADNTPYHYKSDTRDIDISVDGNGTYSKIYYEKPGWDQPSSLSSIGTRSRQEDTINWSGTQLRYLSSRGYHHWLETVFETSNTTIGRELVQKGSGRRTGKEGPIEDVDTLYDYNYDAVLDLDSMDSDNTCAVLHGDFSYTLETNIGTDNPILRVRTLSRNSTDENWTWTLSDSSEEETNSGGESIELEQRLYCNFPID